MIILTCFSFFKPKVCLPLGLSEQERCYIILHEQTHIRRRDHIVKFAAYFVLCLHWPNPLAWVAFHVYPDIEAHPIVFEDWLNVTPFTAEVKKDGVLL